MKIRHATSTLRAASLRTFAVGCVLVLAGSVAWAGDAPPAPWLDVPPFEVPPAVLLSAAYAHPFPDGADAVVLLNESTTRLDEQHRTTQRIRRLLRIVTPNGVRGWSDVSLDYSPWHQERPIVRARVITPDGVPHELDPDTLAESPFGAQVPNVYSDHRLLAGTLPAVSVGAVVELEIELRDRQPLFAAGVARWSALQFAFPVRKLRVVVDVPSTLTFRYAVRGLSDIEAERTEAGGRTRIVVERGPLDARDEPEPFAPSDATQTPYLSWSTGESWAVVARGYSAIVEERLRDVDLAKSVRKVLKKLKGASTPREEITALAMKLHADVRYTGVEFGKSGIVPASPNETLARRFGDCKDTATLLVAMLRAAGFDAHVALVDSGLEPDLDVEMPGLGFFDHAIVHVVDPEMWIDPTTPYSRPGVLLVGVEDRVALIASPETTSTIRTPALTALENRSVETRDVFLAERGGARVVEVTEASGAYESDFREGYATVEPEDHRDVLKAYAENAYLGEGASEFETSDPTDLATPMRIRVQIDGAEVAFAAPEQAVVTIPTFIMAEKLREFLPWVDPGRPGRPGKLGEDDDDSTRKSDFRVPWPYRLEWHYRIHPAPGFRPAPLPPEATTEMGPVRLTQRFSQQDDGTVVADIVFDTGKRRWTPTELQQVWTGLERLQKEGATLLGFEQIGRKYLANGQVREALAEFRRLATLHPEEALHRDELAEALIVAGLGEAAREEARRAVELEPEDDDAHRTLGWVLLHDPIARFLHAGYDPAGAEVEFRKARELDPSDIDNRGYLAYLLGLDLRLLPPGSPARLDEAIAEYRSIRDELDDRTYDGELALALLQVERYEELVELLTELPPSAERNAMWIATAAATEGVDAAFARAWSLAGAAEQRHALIGQAAQFLMGNRRYAEAARMLKEGIPRDASAPELSFLIDVLSRTRRHETLEDGDEPPPVAFMNRIVVEMVGSSGQSNSYFDRLADVRRDFPDEAETTSRLIRLQFRSLQNELAQLAGNALDLALDMYYATVEWTVEGDAATGYRCRAKFHAPGQESRVTYYIVVEDGEHRLLAVEPRLWVLGLEALRRLESDDASAARRLLGWAHDARPLRRSEDPVAVPPFLLFDVAASDSEAELRYAAAALVAGSEASDVAIPVLEAGRASVDESERPGLDAALLAAYVQQERWDDVLAVARRLRAVYPESEVGFRMETSALHRMERWDELAEIANRRLEAREDDRAALQVLSSAASAQGQRERSEALLKRIVAAGTAGPFEYNNLAWLRVESGQVDDETVQYAERAALFNPTPSVAELHTLAAVYAEVERYSEARELMLRHLLQRGAEEPGPLEWQVFGRIAEGYGEIDTAILFYGRVTAPSGDPGDCEPCYELAQQRVAALQTPLSKPP